MLQCRAIELWRPVYGLEDLFSVSNCGGVRSADRLIQPSRDRRGYRHVNLLDKRRSVHSLVLEAFVRPRPPGLMGLHRDDVKWHNHVSNLYWGTAADNMRDCLRNGTHLAPKKTHCPRGHMLAEPNLVVASLPIRICKACNRARGLMRYRYGRDYPQDVMKALADEQYERIVSFDLQVNGTRSIFHSARISVVY